MIYLIAGLLLGALNFMLMRVEKIEDIKFTQAAMQSTFVLTGLCALALLCGFFIYVVVSCKYGSKIAAADDDGTRDMHFM